MNNYNESEFIDKYSFIHNIKNINRLSIFFITLTILYATSYLLIYAIKQPYFKINSFIIHTKGGVEVNLNLIQEQISKHDISFFSASLDNIRNIFTDIPSIKKANLIRKYPNRVDIFLETHTPFAKWGYQNNLYINADGAVYEGSNYDDARTSINLYSLNDEDSKLLLTQYYEFTKNLKYKIASINYTKEKNWVLTILDNNKNIKEIKDNVDYNQNITLTLGKESNDILMKKINFWQKNWDKLRLQPEYVNINTFDLRYNGFTMKRVEKE